MSKYSSVFAGLLSPYKDIKPVKEFAQKVDGFKKGERLDLLSLIEVPINKTTINTYKVIYHQLAHVRTDDNYKGSLFFEKDPLPRRPKHLVGYVNVESDGTIQALETMPEYRGRTIGKQLLKYAAIRYRANALTVNKNNEVAINMYKRYGYKAYDQNSTMLFMER